MARPVTASIALALFAAGCSDTGKLDIRSVGDASFTARAGSDQLSLAAGELAIGNVGLALESYRRALRDDPKSVDALIGIGVCYDHMGRFDLSRRAYEQALAIAPGDQKLYQALAASLDAQGLAAEAGAVQREAAARRGTALAPAMTADGSVASFFKSAALPAPTVTVMLPPPRPAANSHRSVRLERLSLGEVALLTSPNSPWAAHQLAAAPRWKTIRSGRGLEMVVLNAARVAGVAARARDYLARRGFAAARIGDAAAISRHSVIRFAPTQRAQAMRIAAQFPFATPVAVASGPLTLVVGRDAPAVLLRRG